MWYTVFLVSFFNKIKEYKLHNSVPKLENDELHLFTKNVTNVQLICNIYNLSKYFYSLLKF